MQTLAKDKKILRFAAQFDIWLESECDSTTVQIGRNQFLAAKLCRWRSGQQRALADYAPTTDRHAAVNFFTLT